MYNSAIQPFKSGEGIVVFLTVFSISVSPKIHNGDDTPKILGPKGGKQVGAAVS